jgi:hypothetical protein
VSRGTVSLSINRESSATIADLTEKLNKAIEDLVFSQTEWEERRQSDEEKIQRMKERIKGKTIENNNNLNVWRFGR